MYLEIASKWSSGIFSKGRTFSPQFSPHRFDLPCHILILQTSMTFTLSVHFEAKKTCLISWIDALALEKKLALSLGSTPWRLKWFPSTSPGILTRFGIIVASVWRGFLSKWCPGSVLGSNPLGFPRLTESGTQRGGLNPILPFFNTMPSRLTSGTTKLIVNHLGHTRATCAATDRALTVHAAWLPRWKPRWNFLNFRRQRRSSLHAARHHGSHRLRAHGTARPLRALLDLCVLRVVYLSVSALTSVILCACAAAEATLLVGAMSTTRSALVTLWDDQTGAAWATREVLSCMSPCMSPPVGPSTLFTFGLPLRDGCFPPP